MREKTESRRRRGPQRMGWLDGVTDPMGMSVSKLQKMAKGREAWHATVHGSQRVRHDWGIEQQQRFLHLPFFFPSFLMWLCFPDSLKVAPPVCRLLKLLKRPVHSFSISPAYFPCVAPFLPWWPLTQAALVLTAAFTLGLSSFRALLGSSRAWYSPLCLHGRWHSASRRSGCSVNMLKRWLGRQTLFVCNLECMITVFIFVLIPSTHSWPWWKHNHSVYALCLTFRVFKRSCAIISACHWLQPT